MIRSCNGQAQVSGSIHHNRRAASYPDSVLAEWVGVDGVVGLR